MTEYDFDIETDYSRVVINGEVIAKGSPHNDGMRCDCDMDAPLARYRDLRVKYDGMEYHIYHSTAIVIELGDGKVRLSNGGWHTMSTKERINRALQNTELRVFQKDGDWYVETSEDVVPFKSGMILELQS